MTVVVVAGTDTGVGKTIVTAALAVRARAEGRQVAVVKPVQTGVADTEPGDLDEVRRLSGVDDLHELARLPDPLAPATAARVADSVLPSVADAADAVDELRDRDLVVVEGSGGLLVHLDGQGGTIADLARALEAAVLVVARAGLGTLNHTALTCEALRSRGVACGGIVIGAWPKEPDLTARCNLEDLPIYCGEPVVGLMPEGSSALDPPRFLAAATDALTEEALT